MAKMEDRALYYEDVEMGTVAVSPARTLGEGDLLQFAGISGDYNPLHTDEEFARSSTFGARIAHGLLTASVASGLFTRTSLSNELQPALIAMLGMDVRFMGPVFVGDTVHVVATVADKRLTSGDDRGIVTLEREVRNQRGEVVQRAVTPLLMATRSRRSDGQ